VAEILEATGKIGSCLKRGEALEPLEGSAKK
jgi:hypothetical protein